MCVAAGGAEHVARPSLAGGQAGGGGGTPDTWCFSRSHRRDSSLLRQRQALCFVHTYIYTHSLPATESLTLGVEGRTRSSGVVGCR